MAKLLQKETDKLESAELWRDEKDGNYYLRLEYLCETESEIFKIIFPKVGVGIPLCGSRLRYRVRNEMDVVDCKMLFNTPDAWHYLFPDEDGNVYYEEIISKKTHELTLEDIEKKLGYKVKIVSDEDKGVGSK